MPKAMLIAAALLIGSSAASAIAQIDRVHVLRVGAPNAADPGHNPMLASLVPFLTDITQR